MTIDYQPDTCPDSLSKLSRIRFWQKPCPLCFRKSACFIVFCHLQKYKTTRHETGKRSITPGEQGSVCDPPHQLPPHLANVQETRGQFLDCGRDRSV